MLTGRGADPQIRLYSGITVPLRMVPFSATVGAAALHVHQYFGRIIRGGVGKNGSTVAVSGADAVVRSPRSALLFYTLSPSELTL